jgi:NADH-quinone oxidoreductase subunit N
MLGLGAFLPEPTKPGESRYRFAWGWGMVLALWIAGIISWLKGIAPPDPIPGLFLRDTISRTGEQLTLLGGLLLSLMGWHTTPTRQLPERYGCLALLLAGLMFVGNSADLTTLFLALELVSIPTYVLLGLAGGRNHLREATLKYFSLSAFSSALFLFGLSYLYGITGSTAIEASTAALRSAESPLAGIAWVMILGGLAFRITAFPFHFYAPDVFAGTTTSMAAALSYLPKVAGFLAILRLVGPDATNLPTNHIVVWSLASLAAITMTLGNVLAFVQTNVRRLLAYSSVAHSGYLMLGLAVTLHAGYPPQAIFFYLSAYAVMTLGAFAALESLETPTFSVQELGDLQGASSLAPWSTASLAVSLVSLIGLPLTAGFWAKLQILVMSISSGESFFRGGAILLAINAAIAAGYYLPILVRLYLPGSRPSSSIVPHPSATLASTMAAALSILWFFRPMG